MALESQEFEEATGFLLQVVDEVQIVPKLAHEHVPSHGGELDSVHESTDE